MVYSRRDRKILKQKLLDHNLVECSHLTWSIDGTDLYFCTFFHEITSCLKSGMIKAPKRTENFKQKMI